MKSLVQYILEAFKLRDDTKIINPDEKKEWGTKDVERYYDEIHWDKKMPEQIEKMRKWHQGTRKQNITACSDKKLKMNYAICVHLGFDNEARQLKKEIDSRGLTFN